MFYKDQPVFAKTEQEKLWRAEEFKFLRSELKKTGLKPVDLMKIMEIKSSTYKQYPCIKNGKLPTLYSLERLRSVLITRTS